RRDLNDFTAWLGGAPGAATKDELDGYVAKLRADGLAATTVARRVAALRSFFRHQMLLGARADNPAAELELPRRRRALPKTLSPGEVERGAVDLENRLVRALGKGSKERIVPIGREAADALRRYLAHGRPFLDK